MRIIRVFPAGAKERPGRTAYTPIDGYSFIGEPQLWVPECDEVHVSVTFSWHVEEAYRLVEAWRSVCDVVRIGGPAVQTAVVSEFRPGFYVRHGVTFTSRGCNNDCPWCLVPKREGKLRGCWTIEPGHIIQDNNFLQTSASHRYQVYRMLNAQPRAAKFAGGLQANLVTDEVADELRGLRIEEVYLAADSDGALKPLGGAIRRLSFLPRRKLRCYVLLAYGGENCERAEARLERVWELGALPFAQLYRPPDREIEYSREWRDLARKWSRPAAIFAAHKEGR